MGYNPVPASSETLCQYVAYLARTKTYSTIRQYLNIIQMLHQEWQLPNPVKSDYELQMVLKGVRRIKGDQVIQKRPITPDLLISIYNVLRLADPRDACFWASALVMFFTLLRRSNVLPQNFRAFSPCKHLSRNDFRFFPWGVLVTVKWSKTIQYRDRSLSFPLPKIPNHPLCPVRAIIHAFSLAPQAPGSAPAWLCSQSMSDVLTVPMFIDRLKQCVLLCNRDPAEFAGHSFRRGGAQWAFKCGVPVDTIKVLGDWKSDAYQAYVKPDFSNLYKSLKIMQSQLPPTP